MIAPGPLLADVTQFVPAVREAGTPDQQAQSPRPGRRGRAHRHARDRRAVGLVRPRRRRRDDRRSTATTSCSPATKRFVIEGDAVDELVVVGRARRSPAATTASARSSSRSPRSRPRPLDAFDGSRRLVHVTLDGVRVDARPRARRPDASAAPALRRALEEATVRLALEMVGTAQTIFDITLEYAKHREQFGVPIGSFQAIKHKFADMMIALERARSTRLLRRAHDRRGRRRGARAPRRWRRPRPATASGCSPRRASRSTAASATRGSTTCTST